MTGRGTAGRARQAAAGLGILGLCCGTALAQPEPAQTVSTAIARSIPWQDSVEATGTVRAVRGADLSAELPGIVDWIGFESGHDVAAGAVLLKLRPNDDPAKLAELQAAAELAAANAARDTKQFHAQAVSQATLDADESTLRGARARVAEQQAMIDEKVVRAPFAGRLGLRLVDLGQYLPTGTTIVTLQALDPVYVDFYVPQQVVGSLAANQALSVHVDGFAGRDFQGRLSAISPKVDVSTRMAQLRAEVANPDHALLPGMFATVHVTVGPPVPRLTLPNAAIVYAPYGNTVFVVQGGAQKTVREAVVQLGPTRGDQVAITAGLHQGDEVVTAGQVKLRPDMPVVVNNSVEPPDSANPHPAEE